VLIEAAGRRWAYVGALLGAGVSVAANVAHSYVPPDEASASWSPHAGAVAEAVFWPVALLVAIEVLARVAWPQAVRWTVIRFGGLGPVAGVAAVVSYRHLSALLAYYGEDRITSAVGPLAVDGLMVMATGALLATRLTTSSDRTCATRASDSRPSRGERMSGDRTSPAERPDNVTTSPQRGRPVQSRVSATDTEPQVAALRDKGLSTRQIAAELAVSERTVRRRMANHRARE
jgi:DNA-binding CsgD family transcriptional regulator